MSDKSPRQNMSKKSGKSIKEKRAEKRKGAGRVLLRHDPPAEEEVTLLSLGVVGTSAKENEYRLPLHPEHLPLLDPDLRARITLEHGYGARFGASDASLAEHVAGFASRAELLADSDVVLLPKPQHEDVAALSSGPGAVGLAALRPGHRTHPARDRPTPHADRVRGDEPLDE